MKKTNHTPKKKIVIVSGGFDPLHIGHIRMFEAAKKLGDELVVVLNNDVWLSEKKGAPFMAGEERKEILEALRVVDRVVLTKHSLDDPDYTECYPRWRSICQAMREIKPDVFAQGGDRNEADAADPESSAYYERLLCEEIHCVMVHNIGHGGKVQSSSWLTEKVVQAAKQK